MNTLLEYLHKFYILTGWQWLCDFQPCFYQGPLHNIVNDETVYMNNFNVNYTYKYPMHAYTGWYVHTSINKLLIFTLYMFLNILLTSWSEKFHSNYLGMYILVLLIKYLFLFLSFSCQIASFHWLILHSWKGARLSKHCGRSEILCIMLVTLLLKFPVSWHVEVAYLPQRDHPHKIPPYIEMSLHLYRKSVNKWELI